MKIFLRNSDSKRDFNGSLGPAIAADCRFIYFLGPDFGFRARMEGRIWLKNHNGLADLHTPTQVD